MTTAIIIPALLCLLPALALLGALVVFDSYKLVPLRMVLALTMVGAVTAMICYVVNGWLFGRLGIGLQPFSRYVSPFVEEACKGAVFVWLIRRRRIGFLVDAAIDGFALGCGFALAENLYALWRMPDPEWSTWLVRGFGTAIMHGGAVALFAVISVGILEQHKRRGPAVFLPGYATAVALHSAFNHLSRESALSVPLVLVAVLLLLWAAYQRGERTLEHWLGRGFRANAEVAAIIRSGRVNHSPTGRYLTRLETRFGAPVVDDLLRYLQLSTDLYLQAKGVVMTRESGVDTAMDAQTRAQLGELKHLERGLGRTGLLALHPLLPMRRKVLAQMFEPTGRLISGGWHRYALKRKHHRHHRHKQRGR